MNGPPKSATRPVFHVRLECGCHRTTRAQGKITFYCLTHDDWYGGVYIKRTDLEQYETHAGEQTVKLKVVK